MVSKHWNKLTLHEWWLYIGNNKLVTIKISLELSFKF